MKEIISLHFGQAGIQIGNAVWELLSAEQDIQPDGSCKKPGYFGSFFRQGQKTGKFKPRALLLDLEPSVADQARKAQIPYNQDNIITGKEDAANNYIRGHYTIGRDYVDQYLDQIRKQIEATDYFQGFMGYNSLSGGTGAGVGSLILQRLDIQYSKKQIFLTSVAPSPNICDTVVQPMNAILGISDSQSHVDSHLLVNNEALYELCTKKMQIESPDYCVINRLIAQIISSITLPMRSGENILDLNILSTNLVNYPRIHYLQAAHAPLFSVNEMSSDMSLPLLASSCYQNKLLKTIHIDEQKQFYSCWLYRGDNSFKQILDSCHNVSTKLRIEHPNYIPTNVLINSQNKTRFFSEKMDLGRTPRAVTRLFSNLDFKFLFRRIAQKFDILYAKRSFVHWYVGEGLDEGFFGQARELIRSLIIDYNEVRRDTDDSSDSQF